MPYVLLHCNDFDLLILFDLLTCPTELFPPPCISPRFPDDAFAQRLFDGDSTAGLVDAEFALVIASDDFVTDAAVATAFFVAIGGLKKEKFTTKSSWGCINQLSRKSICIFSLSNRHLPTSVYITICSECQNHPNNARKNRI